MCFTDRIQWPDSLIYQNEKINEVVVTAENCSIPFGPGGAQSKLKRKIEGLHQEVILCGGYDVRLSLR